jgi:hypothetical protein
MISIKYKYNFHVLIISAVIFLSACNKEVEQFTELAVTPPTGLALGETLAANPDDSLFYRLIVRAGMLSTINNKATSYSMFAPGNNAMKVFINAISGGLVPLSAPDAAFSAFISTNIPAATAASVVSYNIVPQALPIAKVHSSFPNFQYPTILNPAPSVSALLRLTIFPTTRNGAWVNNIPLTGTDVTAANGVIHTSAFLVTPPQRFLWDRINTDTALTYLKAGFIRADSGVAANSPVSLIGALSNIGANLTVFAPTDSALRPAITGAIYLGLVRLGIPPAGALPQAIAMADSANVFENPLLFSVLSAQTVKGLLVYHILDSRAFTNNFPTNPTLVQTLLNSAVPVHPGVTLQSTFTAGFPFVTSATVKGAGSTTPSNIIINRSPLIPDPFGSSDQHYLNGVLHKIDRMLLPQ